MPEARHANSNHIPDGTELTGAGYIAAKRTSVGTSELIHKFDPAAEETLFIPRLIGG